MKRQCQNCGAKFFDLNRSPIVCPKCGTTYQITAPTARAARAANREEEADTDSEAVEIVSLDEADAAEGKDTAVSADDIEIDTDDDEAADETFLEEEEGDADDVSNLIDGDIETDEES